MQASGERREIAAEFRRSRWRELLGVSLVVVSVVGAAVAASVYDLPGGPIGNPPGLAALGVVVGYIIFHHFNWRCPACRRYLGPFNWSAGSCARCGAEFTSSSDD